MPTPYSHNRPFSVLLSLVTVSSLWLVSGESRSDTPTRLPFSVPFDTTAPLGLRLDADLTVVGFSGSNGPAESSGWIQAGDSLTGVAGESVKGRGLPYAVTRIRDAPLPKVLTFVPRRPGEDRAAAVAAQKAQDQLSSEAGGALELAVVTSLSPAASNTLSSEFPPPSYESRQDGKRVLVYRLPFVRALFGGQPDCAPRPVVLVQPASGCTSFDNEPDVADAVAVVTRGGCAFSDKAVNIQVADGAGMVVINTNGGAAIPMPLSDSERSVLHLPSVMVSADDGVTLQAVLAALTSAPAAVSSTMRMQPHDVVCPASWFPAVTPDQLEAEAAKLEADAASRGSGLTRDWSDDSVPPDAAGVMVLKAAAPGATATVGADGSTEESSSSGSGSSRSSSGDGSSDGRVDSVKLEFVRAEFGATLDDALGRTDADADADTHEGAASSPPPRVIVYAEPLFACEPLRNKPETVKGAVVVVERGGCTFEAKYRAVAAAGGALLVVVNNDMGLFAMPTDDNPRGDGDDAALAASSGTAAVMVTREAAASLRKLARGTLMPAVASVSHRPLLRRFWEELVDLLRHDEWPAEFRDRRKMYFSQSILHHPDRAGGSQARFELLSFAYRRANYRYDPESKTEFEDDYS